MKTAALAVLVAVTLPALTIGSPIVFERTFGGPGDDMGSCAQQTSDGGYIVTGFYDVPTDSGFGWLIKTDAFGDTVWTRKLGGAWALQTADSGYIALGRADSSDSGPEGVCLVKTDDRGDMLWSQVYAGSDNGENMVEQTADGGYVMTGLASLFGPNGGDVHIIKTDSVGDTLWTRTYGGPGLDDGLSIRQTSDHGYVIAALTMSFGAGNQKIWVIKTDSMGDTLWTRLFGGDSISASGWAQQTTDGGYFVAGWTCLYSPTPQTYLIKTDSVGDTLWTRTIGGRSYFTEGLAGQQVNDGGHIVAGGCEDTTTGNIDVYLARTDANGDTLWTRTFGGSSYDCGYSVRQTADGGYVICGQTYSFGAGGSDFYLIKTEENGNLAIAESKASSTRAPALSLACSPNPFSASTRISLTSGVSGSGVPSLRVFDVQGRLVKRLTASRESYVVWDGTDDSGRPLPSGPYFVRREDAGEHAIARIILQRQTRGMVNAGIGARFALGK
jgi:hypothetical protein